MYRLKRDAALSASLEIEFEKDAQKAILFSTVAAVLSIVDNADRKISIAGISIDLKEQFLLNGTFCAIAIFYGVSAFLIGLKLYGVGWPRQFHYFSKRYIFRRRNKSAVGRYHPRRVKFEVRLICFIVNLLMLSAGILMITVYIYGINATIPDLAQIVSLLFQKLFG
ncbi:hypothetical protein [Agrobacterium tumefaciens]|uniref:hypothetical protein n=1 Tax=Agrobacterium tumefaciens TaxID=358 RepID=UPI00165934C3|nr:hypothetical protein [Agrobacterium tumefaciens]QNP78596.1 hypothetical protein IAI05_08525 [Agrobacterium tumefaciens]